MTAHIVKKQVIKATLISSVINLLLGVTKVIIGVLFYSQSLIMDGVHSISDLLTDGFVLFISKFSFEHADEEHPYGHGRFETLGTVVIGCVLISVAFFLAFENIHIFLEDKIREIPRWPTIVVAIVSIVLKEGIYQYSSRVAKKVKSSILEANAWHARSDAMTSIIVLIGLVFSMYGFTEVDLLMAVLLSFFIGKVGWDFIWKSVVELLDTSLDQGMREDIKYLIGGIHGVKGLHNLRSRKVGDKAILDVNIEVAPNITVSEGHEIATWVAQKIIKHFDSIYDVTVHTDVEDDREDGQDFVSYISELLPLRDKVMPEIETTLGSELYTKILDIRLHYIKHQIHLDLYFSPDDNFQKNDYDQQLKENPLFGKIKYFKII